MHLHNLLDLILNKFAVPADHTISLIRKSSSKMLVSEFEYLD